MNEPAGTLAIDSVEGGIAFWIHVTPRARRAKVGAIHGDALRIDVAAEPVDGRANAACREALARALEIPRRCIEIAPAAKHRRKRVRILGDAAELEAHVRALAEASRVG